MVMRPETKVMRAVQAVSSFESDRVEIGLGGTPGFPDVVFWVDGVALPVEFKVGAVIDGLLRFDLRPAQRLWWRRACLQDRKALLCVGVRGRLFWLRPVEVVGSDGPGLPASSLWVTGVDELAVDGALRELLL